jgi:predicted nucleotidyltransferase
MIAARDIEAVVDQIVREFSPERVILFGSYAYGTPTGNSDVDLMVIRRYRGSHIGAGERIEESIDSPHRIQVLVRSPTEIRRRVAWGDMFIVGILRRGIVLHDTIDRGVGEQGRRRLRHRIRFAAVPKAQAI